MSGRHRSSASPLALAYAALVLYASLYPFIDWNWPAGADAGDLLALPWPPWIDRLDVALNVAGYLPLGALVLVAARRSGWRLGPCLLLAVGAPALLSYGAEVAQQFLPGRHPSAKDWAANTGGAVAGAALAAVADRLGMLDRWHAFRERWFVRQSAGALALLALWPVGLLFPAPLPLGLGQVWERLRQEAIGLLEDVPWADPVLELLESALPAIEPLSPLSEGLATLLGLLAPCLMAYAVVPPGWRRVVLALGALALALAAMTLSTLLNFGPQHALTWMTPVTPAALAAGTAVAALLAPAGRMLAAALALAALTGLVLLVSQAPADPYLAQSLQSWEQGRFVRFHGLAQWIGWLWPYAAMAWLLTRLKGTA